MKQSEFGRLGWVFVAGVALVGCSTPSEDDTAQRAVSRDLANIVLYPWQMEVATAAMQVKTMVADFCTTPNETNLKAAQDAWRAARVPWKRAEMMRFGPSEDLRLGSAIDFWPVRPDTIEAAITNAPDPIDAPYIAGLGTTSKGMPALEYMIFDPAGGNTAIMTAIGGTDAAAVRRCSYARALAEQFANDAASLEKAWNPTGGDFVDQVANAGAGSTLFTSGQTSVNELVNLLNASLQAVNGDKLSTPLGTATGTPDPTLVESRFSDNSIQDLVDNLHGVEEVYYGKHGDKSGQGLTVLVSARSKSIDAAVKQAITDAQTQIMAIPPPLRTAITDHADAVNATHTAIRNVRIRLSTDVASVLGVSILLTDSDGD